MQLVQINRVHVIAIDDSVILEAVLGTDRHLRANLTNRAADKRNCGLVSELVRAVTREQEHWALTGFTPEICAPELTSPH